MRPSRVRTKSAKSRLSCSCSSAARAWSAASRVEPGAAGLPSGPGSAARAASTKAAAVTHSEAQKRRDMGYSPLHRGKRPAPGYPTSEGRRLTPSLTRFTDDPRRVLSQRLQEILCQFGASGAASSLPLSPRGRGVGGEGELSAARGRPPHPRPLSPQGRGGKTPFASRLAHVAAAEQPVLDGVAALLHELGLDLFLLLDRLQPDDQVLDAVQLADLLQKLLHLVVDAVDVGPGVLALGQGVLVGRLEVPFVAAHLLQRLAVGLDRAAGVVEQALVLVAQRRQPLQPVEDALVQVDLLVAAHAVDLVLVGDQVVLLVHRPPWPA